MAQALFLTFEGIDGCGKTTQLVHLANRLRLAGREVVETMEPGGTAVGRAIRGILLDPHFDLLSSRAELLLYFASRAQNVAEVIQPALERGAIVLCDRFTDSTVVYQGAGRGISREEILDLHRVACGTLQPDLTLLLDIDLETSLARARRRNHLSGSAETRMEEESRNFFERVCTGYRDLAADEPRRVKNVDARESVEVVAENVWREVASYV